MTDAEKLLLIKKIVANSSQLEWDEKICGLGEVFGMLTAIDCIISFKGDTECPNR